MEAKAGNFFIADLWKKDEMFGRPAEPVMVPLKPGATNCNLFLADLLKKDEMFGRPAEPVMVPLKPGATNCNLFLADLMKKDEMFGRPAEPVMVPLKPGATNSNFFLAELLKKDEMFGRPAEPDMVPLKPTTTTSLQKPAAWTPKLVDHNDLVQQLLEKGRFFDVGDSRSEVKVQPVVAPRSFGDVAVPEAPSHAAKNVGETRNKPPVEVLQVHDLMLYEGVFIQDSGKANLLKEMEAKDLMFTGKPLLQ